MDKAITLSICRQLKKLCSQNFQISIWHSAQLQSPMDGAILHVYAVKNWKFTATLQAIAAVPVFIITHDVNQT